jgi:uncharacterized protein YjbI with pentapeptide repeats
MFTEAVERLEDHREYAALSLLGCDFANQIAGDIVFEQVHLRRVAFTRSHLTKIRLSDTRAEVAELSGAVWEKARFRRVEFIGCRLLGIQLLEAQMEDVLFRECNLERAVLARVACKAVRFEKCILHGASLEEADLTGVAFAECDLTDTDVRGAKLHGADFRSSTIDGLRATAREWQGAIIAPAQAVQVVGLLGVTVREDEER